MNPTGIGLHEERVRVTCHLPINTLSEETAVDGVLDYLKSLRAKPFGVKGFTRSQMRPATFIGYWWSSLKRRWVVDKLVVLTIDYKLDFSDLLVSREIKSLKEEIRNCYRECGSPQEEVWVVAHQIYRQD